MYVPHDFFYFQRTMDIPFNNVTDVQDISANFTWNSGNIREKLTSTEQVWRVLSSIGSMINYTRVTINVYKNTSCAMLAITDEFSTDSNKR